MIVPCLSLVLRSSSYYILLLLLHHPPPPIPIAIPFSSPHQYNTIAIPIAIYCNTIYCSLSLYKSNGVISPNKIVHVWWGHGVQVITEIGNN